MAELGRTIQKRSAGRMSARYRPTIGARLHYVLWTILIFALWPVAVALTVIKKTRHHE